MKLFVDDVRTPPEGWVVARSVAEAIAHLNSGAVEEISLDYFIGADGDETFLPVAYHIAGMAARPKTILYHTASAAGAARMAFAIGGR